jgi:thymidine kinase
MIAQEYILSCTHQKDDTPVRAQTLVIMLRPQDVFKRALDIMTLCDEIETMVKVCGSCKIYR